MSDKRKVEDTILSQMRKATNENEAVLKNIESMYEAASMKQSQIDQLIVDIEHEIELESCSAPLMMAKYKQLKACFKLRRKYKDELEYFLSIRGSLNLGITTTAQKALTTVAGRMDKRKYSHRIREELRLEILKEAEEI